MPDKRPQLGGISEEDYSSVLKRMARAISSRSGIARAFSYVDNSSDDPSVYRATADPSSMFPMTGRKGLNRGSATSLNKNRAAVKALGECIERYCAGYYHTDEMNISSYNDLQISALAPGLFPRYEDKEYLLPNFPFKKPSNDLPVRWVIAEVLGSCLQRLVPAAMVYVPYQPEPPEAWFCEPISTGLACGSSIAQASYKAIVEVIERDAFMIAWKNLIPGKRISLCGTRNLEIAEYAKTLSELPYVIDLVCINHDISIPVVLAIARAKGNSLPQTAIGMGADLSIGRAVLLAFEELSLGICGMGQLAAARNKTVFRDDYSDIKTLDDHGLLYALNSSCKSYVEFLLGSTSIHVDDWIDTTSNEAETKLDRALEALKNLDLEALMVDLTTRDIDSLGLKVVRVIIPGTQPLDISHSYKYERCPRASSIGVTHNRNTNTINPNPHPFP